MVCLGGGEGGPTAAVPAGTARPPGAWPVLSSLRPDTTRQSASVMRAAGCVVRRDPEAAAGARSAVSPHGRWVSWVSGLGVQKTSTAIETHMRCGLETPVQGKSSHWTLLRSLCTCDGHTSASSPSAPGLPGGHRPPWWAPHPTGSPTRSLKGQCWQGLWTGVVTPPTTRPSPSRALLQVCCPGPADRPARNGP